MIYVTKLSVIFLVKNPRNATLISNLGQLMFKYDIEYFEESTIEFPQNYLISI